MAVEYIETMGSGAMSYDNALGDVTTRIFVCDLDDMALLWGEFAHNVPYPELGGYFLRTRSSCTPGARFATLTMMFAQQPETRSSGGAGGTHEDGDTEYNFVAASTEKALEQHPNYRTSWNYELLAIDGTTTSPAWWLTATDTKIPADDRATYQWVKPGTRVDGWFVLFGVYHEEAPSTVDFRGVETFADDAVSLSVTEYYRKREGAVNQLLANNHLKSPPWSGPYDSAAIKWRISSSTVQKAGKYWACVTLYEYANIGWNTALYNYA